MAWSGFETTDYPGDAVMKSLWNDTPLIWTAFRLGPTARQADDSWMTRYDTLSSQGWGVAPVYTGAEAVNAGPGEADGADDGLEAAGLASSGNLPAGSTLFLDHEHGSADGDSLTYVEAWIGAVQAAGYRPGLRAPSDFASRYSGRDTPIALWITAGGLASTGDGSTDSAFLPPPRPDGSSVPDAMLWRFLQAGEAGPLTGATADAQTFSVVASLSSAVVSNPLTAASFAGAAGPSGGGVPAQIGIDPATGPFPFPTISIALAPGGAKGSATRSMSDTLAAAQAARTIDPKIKVAVIDMTDGALDYGGLNDTDMVFAASLSKIEPFCAAFALREALKAAINGVVAYDPMEVLRAVEAAWGPDVRKRFPTRPGDFPKLSTIFDVTAAGPAGAWNVAFRSDGKSSAELAPLHGKPGVAALKFLERMTLMAQFSDNIGAGTTIRDLGFQYVAGTMASLGLFDEATDKGLFLGKDYIGGVWGAVPNFGGQRAHAKAVATYFAALGLHSIFRMAGPAGEMLTILDRHRTRSFIEESFPDGTFDVHASKIGLYEMADLPASSGPAHDGGYFEKTVNGKTVKYAAAILNGSIPAMHDAARVVDDLIINRNV